MGLLTDDSPPGPCKVILISESGDGKTGAKAALMAMGYKIRSINTDNGAPLLRALMTDSAHYPYAEIAKAHNVDLREAFHSQDIETPMTVRSTTHKIKTRTGWRDVSERALVPKDGKAWDRIISCLDRWKDDKAGVDYGPVSSWGPDCILDIDSFTTVSRQAYYMNQEFNGRLGAPEEGFSHQKDVGGAQSQLRRLIEAIFNPAIKCHIILNCHIRGLNDSSGYSQTPEQIKLQNPDAVIEVKGFPQSVGITLSKQVSIYFNDSFVLQRTGSGENVKRTIHTVPTTVNGVNVAAKNSAWLKREYDQRSGLYEIFCALQGKEADAEAVAAMKKKMT